MMGNFKMTINNKLTEFIGITLKSIESNTFVKLTLSKYIGIEPDLVNIYVKQVLIKNEPKLSFTYHYKTKDIVKNYSPLEFQDKLIEFINVNNFTNVNFLTTLSNCQLIVDKFEKIQLNFSTNNHNKPVILNHNVEKARLIQVKSKYLHDLKITDVNGQVYKNTQDKFRQINHYIELLAPLLKNIAVKAALKVVDMGSGKGYLTFALYDYLKNNLQLETVVTGVEYRDDLVQLCNKIAKDSEFTRLQFEKNSILGYSNTEIDILIALHACDTATDDAIFKGISAKAGLIVVAPCCHKQIRKEIEKNKAKNELEFITKHGIFLERQAEMATDGLRALILEYFGYSVKIQQFISDAHTPKNVMITAIKNEKTEARTEKKKAEILAKIRATKAYFGIEKHHLEVLLLDN